MGASAGTMRSGGETARGDSEGAGRDPRPDATAEGLRGGRCAACGYPMLYLPPLCPACGSSQVEPAVFGPGGTVWSSTVLRVRVADRPPPAVLAYVDFDAGPRALVHVHAAAEVALLPGARVRLLGRDDRGDPIVQPVGSDAHVGKNGSHARASAAPASAS